MTKLYSLIITLLFASVSFAQNWVEINDKNLASRNAEEREIIPAEYKVFQSDFTNIKASLTDISTKAEGDILIPMANGKISSFSVYEAPVMRPKLAAKYPNIRSYKGVNETGDIVRFDVSPYGFRASILTEKGEIYIDPYVKGQTENYIVYYVDDFMKNTNDHPTCGVTDHLLEQKPIIKDGSRGVNVTIHEYETAIACTGEWGERRGTVELALSDINTSVNRLNQIFENELAFRIVLIDDNDLITYIDPDTDPYPSSISRTGGALISVNTQTVDQALGHSNYDLGHIFTVGCTDVGGIAFLGSLCNPNLKAGGCSCFANNNVIPTTVSIVSHEMGHQFSASHTFNNCGGNESNTGVEPGSGSTIMSYAGLCGGNNVQNTNYDFYHSISLEQIESHLRTGGASGCATKVATNNVSPDISLDYEDGFFIPAHTPFYLVGSATDENGDNLTYSWEQINTGPIVNLGSPVGNAPLFRVFQPSSNNYRVFPSKITLLNNNISRTEVLPNQTRDLDFNFVVRDNNPEGGYAEWENISFYAHDTGEPFEVTYPNSIAEFPIGEEIEVTWNVAGTDQAPINTEFVDIYFSDNGALVPEREMDGLELLACNTPNDGAEKVVLPNWTTAKGRILIKASNSIYFDVSDRDFKILEPQSPVVFVSTICDIKTICLPNEASYTFTTEAINGFNSDLSFDVPELPSGVNAEFSESSVSPNGETTLTLNFEQKDLVNDYEIRVRIISENEDTLYRDVKVKTIGTDFSDFNIVSPDSESVGVSTLPPFEWNASINAQEYFFQICSSPSFDPDSEFYFEQYTSFTQLNLPQPLEKSSIYYYRIAPINSCGQGEFSETRALSTLVQSCGVSSAINLPKNISGSGIPTVDIPILVTDNVPLDDINVSFTGEHERVNDLVISLISPLSTSVTLVDQKCPVQKSINVTFDDEGTFFKCNYDDGNSLQPSGNLSDFNGENIQGNWILRIEDKVPGSGGKIESVDLEICSSVALNAPYLVNNNQITVSYNESYFFSSSELLSEDADNSAFELIYTVTKIPTKGNLYHNNNRIFVGEQFRQSDLNNGTIKYWANTTELDAQDYFSFTVSDGNGGFIPVTNFNINIQNVSSSEDILKSEFVMHPNPATNHVMIKSSYQTEDARLTIYGLDGKVHFSNSIEKEVTINTVDYANGVYIVVMQSQNGSVAKRLIIQK